LIDKKSSFPVRRRFLGKWLLSFFFPQINTDFTVEKRVRLSTVKSVFVCGKKISRILRCSLQAQTSAVRFKFWSLNVQLAKKHVIQFFTNSFPY